MLIVHNAALTQSSTISDSHNSPIFIFTRFFMLSYIFILNCFFGKLIFQSKLFPPSWLDLKPHNNQSLQHLNLDLFLFI